MIRFIKNLTLTEETADTFSALNKEPMNIYDVCEESNTLTPPRPFTKDDILLVLGTVAGTGLLMGAMCYGVAYLLNTPFSFLVEENDADPMVPPSSIDDFSQSPPSSGNKSSETGPTENGMNDSKESTSQSGDGNVSSETKDQSQSENSTDIKEENQTDDGNKKSETPADPSPTSAGSTSDADSKTDSDKTKPVEAPKSKDNN